ELHSETGKLRDRLLARLHSLSEQTVARAEASADLGLPETLLHGDLWTINFIMQRQATGFHARLIDWDCAGVGPVTYDLSTFLLRFPKMERTWITQYYEEQIGWSLPDYSELNFLFETAEYARFANRIIWPALAL